MRTAIRVISCYAIVSMGAALASGIILVAALVVFHQIIKG